MSDVRYARIDANLDDHPKVIEAGFWGSTVFQFLLRVNRKFGLDGVIPPKFASASYIARQLNLYDALGEHALNTVDLGIERAVDAGLLRRLVSDETGETLHRDRRDSLVIVGWTEEWAQGSSSTERVRKWRERRRSETGETLHATSETVKPLQTRLDQTRPDRSYVELGEFDAGDGLAKGTEPGTRRSPVATKQRLSAKYRDHEPVVERVLTALTRRTGAAFRVCDGHAKLIVARLRDSSASEEDLRLVVWDRSNRWLGTEQEQFLRPSTLFRPGHWDEYLDQARAAWRKEYGDKPVRLGLAEKGDNGVAS